MSHLKLRLRIDRNALREHIRSVGERVRSNILAMFPTMMLEHLYEQAMEAAIYSTPEGEYERSHGLLMGYTIERSDTGFVVMVDGEKVYDINRAAHPHTDPTEVEGYWVRSATDSETWARSGRGYFNFIMQALWADLVSQLANVPDTFIFEQVMPTLLPMGSQHHADVSDPFRIHPSQHFNRRNDEANE